MKKSLVLFLLVSSFSFAESMTKLDCKVEGIIAIVSDNEVTKEVVLECGNGPYSMYFEKDLEPLLLAAITGKLKVNFNAETVYGRPIKLQRLEIR